MIALLVNPTNPNLAEAVTREAQDAARSLRLQLNVLTASTEHDFDTAFSTLAQMQAGGLVIGSDAFFTSRSGELAGLSAGYAIPTIFESREFAAAGGLIKGAKPADLPVQESTKVELYINLKTARALGLTVPTALLVRADEVIE
jgi:putative ABC transport system substrate-binding protein